MFEGLPLNHFGAILADPPWKFETWSDAGNDRAPGYPTMSREEILMMPVNKLAANDCALFMWVTWPLLQQGLEAIECWGFAYKTCAFAWVKADGTQVDMFQDYPVQIGTGYWTRSNSEVALLATRGHPRRINNDVRQAIIEPRREHSRKPDCVHDRIERLVSGPYLELFARSRRPNWTVWGNEVDKFAAPLP